MKFKINVILLLFLVSLGLSYEFFFAYPKDLAWAQKNYIYIHKVAFNGRLKYVDHESIHQNTFAIEGDTIKYKANLISISHHGAKGFYWFAQNGDSIIKAQNSDTVTLIKSNSNEQYYYTFPKPRGL